MMLSGSATPIAYDTCKQHVDGVRAATRTPSASARNACPSVNLKLCLTRAHLHEAPPANARLNEAFGDPARRVSARAVDLRRILAGKSAAAVRAPAAVRVHDDLAAGETCNVERLHVVV